jgi:tRNA (guanine9-N1)-methyltransferase
VFDILLRWVEWRDWKRAFLAVVPQRKFSEVGKGARRKQKGDGDGDLNHETAAVGNDGGEDSELDAEGENDDEMNGEEVEERIREVTRV